MFSPISTYMSMRIGSYKESFSKNTIYRFCNTDGINWHKFVRLLSEEVIDRFIRPATSDKRLETTGVRVIQTDFWLILFLAFFGERMSCPARAKALKRAGIIRI